MKINLNESSNFFFCILMDHYVQPTGSAPKVMPIFQDWPNTRPGGPQVRCCEWFAPPTGPGKWLQHRDSWRLAPWRLAPWGQLRIRPLLHGRSPVLHTVLGMLWGEQGWPAACPCGAHSLAGRKTGSHHPHLDLGVQRPGGAQETSQKRSGREKKESEEWGRKLTQEVAGMS